MIEFSWLPRTIVRDTRSHHVVGCSFQQVKSQREAIARRCMMKAALVRSVRSKTMNTRGGHFAMHALIATIDMNRLGGGWVS